MKTVIRFLGIFCILALTLLVAPYTVSAHSINSKPFSNTCLHLLVTLHGNGPATSQCLDKVSHPQSVNPDTSVTDCGPSVLRIYWDQNQNGYLGEICFIGTGFVNMTEYYGPWYNYKNWNDQASSYQTQCTTGSFFADTNGNGARQIFSYSQVGNFDGQNGHLQNDTLSSIQISNS